MIMTIDCEHELESTMNFFVRFFHTKHALDDQLL